MVGHHYSHPRFPAQELAWIIGLTMEEIGFLQCVRDYAAVQEGIPDDSRLMDRLRAATGNLAPKKKIDKLWTKFKPLFTLEDGKYYFTRDYTRPEVHP
jgi:hypothetical protein